ncbi:MAG: hypothetical protein WAN11_19570 [Syntrophobacteraceae bacterium]
MEGKRGAELAEKRRLWQERLGEWKASGLTQAGYCRLHNLDARNFQYWKKNIEPKPCASAALVEVSADILSRGPSSTHPLCLVIDGRHRIEILPGFDAHTLDRLIRVLDRR